MTLNNLTRTVEELRKALDAALVKEGCARLDDDEWEKIEEVLIASLAKTGLLGYP